MMRVRVLVLVVSGQWLELKSEIINKWVIDVIGLKVKLLIEEIFLFSRSRTCRMTMASKLCKTYS